MPVCLYPSPCPPLHRTHKHPPSQLPASRTNPPYYVTGKERIWHMLPIAFGRVQHVCSMYAHTQTCMHMRMHTHTHTHMLAHTSHIHTHAHAHTHTSHMHKCVCIHTHTHTHTLSLCAAERQHGEMKHTDRQASVLPVCRPGRLLSVQVCPLRACGGGAALPVPPGHGEPRHSEEGQEGEDAPGPWAVPALQDWAALLWPHCPARHHPPQLSSWGGVGGGVVVRRKVQSSSWLAGVWDSDDLSWG